MSARGAIVLGFFGALFAAFTLYWQWGRTGLILATPFVVFAFISGAAAFVMSRSGIGPSLSPQARRAIKMEHDRGRRRSLHRLQRGHPHNPV